MENQCGPDILRDIGMSIPLLPAVPHCAPIGQILEANFLRYQQSVCNQIARKSLVL